MVGLGLDEFSPAAKAVRITASRHPRVFAGGDVYPTVADHQAFVRRAFTALRRRKQHQRIRLARLQTVAAECGHKMREQAQAFEQRQREANRLIRDDGFRQMRELFEHGDDFGINHCLVEQVRVILPLINGERVVEFRFGGLLAFDLVERASEQQAYAFADELMYERVGQAFVTQFKQSQVDGIGDVGARIHERAVEIKKQALILGHFQFFETRVALQL